MPIACLPTVIEVSSAQDAYALLDELESLTEFQFDARVEELQGVAVTGSGEVNDVGSTDWMDTEAPSGYGYKVILHLRGDSSKKVVVFLRTSNGLASLSIGDNYSFSGRLLSVADWGFWLTMYVQSD